MLSATLNGTEDLVRWIANLKNVPCNLVSTEKDITPLQHKIFMNNEFSMIMDDDKWNDGEWNIIKKKSKDILMIKELKVIFYSI